ncbi:MAG: hypothetical protein KJ574_00040 [Nanoarchaeota archaeon]|nr:hypothetical protein [Nanoarchaeota archaeon]
MTFKKAIAKIEKEDVQRAKEIILNQLVASVVILALIIWVAVLFRSYLVIGFLILIVIVMYAAYVPKKKFK